MHCPTCRKAMVSTSSQEMKDEQGAMTITRWRCRPCHETAEEVWMSAGYRGPSPTTSRYAVAGHDRATVPSRSRGGSRRGALAHAALC